MSKQLLSRSAGIIGLLNHTAKWMAGRDPVLQDDVARRLVVTIAARCVSVLLLYEGTPLRFIKTIKRGQFNDDTVGDPKVAPKSLLPSPFQRNV